MGHGKGKSGSKLETPWVPDFNGAYGSPLTVTGTLTPNATGSYAFAGAYNNTQYYKRSDGAFYLWFDPVAEYWYITAALGNPVPGFWRHSGYRHIIGLWLAGNGYVGVAGCTGNYAGPIDMAFSIVGNQTRIRPDFYKDFNTGIVIDLSHWWVFHRSSTYYPSSYAWDGVHSLYFYFDIWLDQSLFWLNYDGKQTNLISLDAMPMTAFYGMKWWA